MKNVRLLATLLAFTFAISACNKDDESPNNDQKIIGKWNIVKVTFESYEDDKLAEREEAEKDEIQGTYLEFKSDKSFTFGTDNDITAGTYSVADNNVTFLVDGDRSTAKINKLDSKSLTISFTETEEDEGVTYKYVEIMEFSK